MTTRPKPGGDHRPPAYPKLIASVCLLGRPARCNQDNQRALKQIERAITLVIEANWPVDLILFPGGTLWSPVAVSTLDHKLRQAVLLRCPSQQKLRKLTRHTTLPLIIGVDTPWDQLVVVYAAGRLKHITRKVWPSPQDLIDGYQPVPTDLQVTDRLIQIGKSTVLLCQCYDAFAIPGAIGHRTARPKMLRQALGQDLDPDDEHEWKITTPPDLVAVTIHEFQQPGRELYWQRHGIAAASAALDGCLVVGAAHYRKSLPRPSQATLAAYRVPSAHLSQGLHRQALPLAPIAWIIETDILVRLYAGPGS